MENCIKELIKTVHDELISYSSKKENLLLVDKLKIEANFIIEQSTETKGDFNLKIVEYGQKENENRPEVHKITLEFKSSENNNIMPMHSSIH